VREESSGKPEDISVSSHEEHARHRRRRREPKPDEAPRDAPREAEVIECETARGKKVDVALPLQQPLANDTN
jgi:hypothetical protein